MRVLRFFFILISSFLILSILFNKSLFSYIEQKYHKDYRVDFALFDVINNISGNFHIVDNKLNLELFELKNHNYVLESANNLSSKQISHKDLFINFRKNDFSYLKDATHKYEADFSMYELILKYNQKHNKKNLSYTKSENSINIKQDEKKEDAIQDIKDDKDLIDNSKIHLNKNDKVLLIGDSLMQGTGMFIIKELKQGEVKTKNIAKQSTGLAYKKFYDWQSELKKALNEDEYKAIVVLMGVNDYWDMINPNNRTKYLKFGSDEWNEVYSSRIKEIVDEAKAKNTEVLWYQLPAVKKKALNDKVAILNVTMENTIKNENYGVFVKVDDIFGDFKEYVKNEEGKKKSVRGSDGVHFTPYGYSLMAKKLLDYIEFDKEINDEK